MGIPSRGKETPETFTMRSIKVKKLHEDQTLDYENSGQSQVARDEYPLFYLYLEFDPPGLFTGRSGDHDRWRPAALLNESEMRKYTPNDKDGFRLAPISMAIFCALLAKIGHAFAVAELGLDAFHPVLTPFIRAESVRILKWIGGESEPSETSTAFHEIGLSAEIIEGLTYVVVRLRLFSFLGTPWYKVVVGQLQSVFDKVSLLKQPIHRIDIETPIPAWDFKPVHLDAWRRG
jgi:hypothetical protein